MITKQAQRGGSFEYTGYMELAWDFDYNCIRTAWSTYSDMNWGEHSYCYGAYLDYISAEKQCFREETGLYSVEQNLNGWLNEYTQWYSDGYVDPVWGEGSYNVIGHDTELKFIYFRNDGAIEFIQDASEREVDYIYYFPNGLSLDSSVWGVWDFNHKYSAP